MLSDFAASAMHRSNRKWRNSSNSRSRPRNVSIPNRETILIYQPLATISTLSYSHFLFFFFLPPLPTFFRARSLPFGVDALASSLRLPFISARAYRGWIAIRCNGFVSFNRPTVDHSTPSGPANRLHWQLV